MAETVPVGAPHEGHAHDARGPNNSLTLGEVYSLSAIVEAMRVIQHHKRLH